jgi:hypothetical protein
MRRRWIGAALLFGLAMATAGTAAGQQRQQLVSPSEQPSIMDEGEDTPPIAAPAKLPHPRGQTATPVFEHDPDLDADDQLAPSQIRQPMPAAVATPTGGEKPKHAAANPADAAVEPAVMPRSKHLPKQYIVACEGVFGRDSSHAKLAAAFQSRNVAFTQVDAASGTVMASVLFGKDPKRRLEVWWSKPASRSDTHLIVINGESDWIAPGEIRLGLTLADLEKLNGKPFKLTGFDKASVAALSDWNGGVLSALPGGCKIGVSLRAASATPVSDLRALSADRAFTSADSAMRAANPKVSEILVAY